VPSLKCQSILEVNNYDSDLTTCWNTGDEAITKLFLSDQSNYKIFLSDKSNYKTISE